MKEKEMVVRGKRFDSVVCLNKSFTPETGGVSRSKRFVETNS